MDAHRQPEPNGALQGLRRRRVARLMSQVTLIAGLVLVPLAAGVTAVAAAPPALVKDVGFDGLNLRVSLRLGDGAVTINSGVLGGLRRPAPTVLGKRVGLVIRPTDTDVSLFTSDGRLEDDAAGVIGHVFADPAARDQELTRVQTSVLFYFSAVAGCAIVLVAMLELMAWVYLRQRRRALSVLTDPGRALVLRDRRSARRAGVVITSVLAAAVTLPGLYWVSPLSNTTVRTSADAQLRGTFLDGWQIVGPLKPLIIRAIDSVDALGRQEQSFYDTVTANLSAQLKRVYGTSTLASEPRVLRLVLLDDLQGTSGMARVVGEAAQAYHADAIINLGDLTATGTSQEAYLSYLKSYTIDVLSHYAADVPIFSSLGRHDTPAVVTEAKKAHIKVADDHPHKVAGLSMIGVNSPFIVNFGEASRLIDPAITSETVAAAVKDTACNSSPAIVYGHDTELFGPLIDSGCAPIVIGGHDYIGKTPRNVTTPLGVTREIVLGSTGGHGAGDGVGGLSTPRNHAPFSVLSINSESGIVSVDTIAVAPDASVDVTTTYVAALSGEQLSRFR